MDRLKNLWDDVWILVYMIIEEALGGTRGEESGWRKSVDLHLALVTSLLVSFTRIYPQMTPMTSQPLVIQHT